MGHCNGRELSRIRARACPWCSFADGSISAITQFGRWQSRSENRMLLLSKPQVRWLSIPAVLTPGDGTRAVLHSRGRLDGSGGLICVDCHSESCGFEAGGLTSALPPASTPPLASSRECSALSALRNAISALNCETLCSRSLNCVACSAADAGLLRAAFRTNLQMAVRATSDMLRAPVTKQNLSNAEYSSADSRTPIVRARGINTVTGISGVGGSCR